MKNNEITHNTPLSEIIPEGFEYNNFQWLDLDSEDCSPSLLLGLKKTVKPAEKANELLFYIGDHIWHNTDYLGQIKSFEYSECNNLMARVSETSSYAIPSYATNNVLIHCTTFEEFKFINYLLKNEIDSDISTSKDRYIFLNPKEWLWTENINTNYTIISVDEYCNEMNIEPLLTTTDETLIYNPYQICYLVQHNDWYVQPMEADECKKWIDVHLIFSTEQLANDYKLEQYNSNKHIPELNKWYKLSGKHQTKCLIYVTKLDIIDDSYYGYGFNYKGVWCNEDLIESYGLGISDLILINETVVQERLLNYAKENYPEKTRIKSFNRGEHIITNAKLPHFDIYENVICCSATSDVNDGIDCILYEDGKWAEIILVDICNTCNETWQSISLNPRCRECKCNFNSQWEAITPLSTEEITKLKNEKIDLEIRCDLAFEKYGRCPKKYIERINEINELLK